MSAKTGAYLGQVMSLFGLRKEDEQEDPSTRARPRNQLSSAQSNVPEQQGVAQEAQDRKDFEARLNEFTATQGAGGGVVAGRVHMLNIEKVRERIGERWPRLAERIHATIKSELKSRLGPRDLFTRVDDNTYVIVFGDCSEVEARLRVAIISEQILEKLLGEDEAKDLSALQVQRLATRADGGVVTEALDRTKALMDILDEAQAAGAAATYDFDDVLSGKRALSSEEVTYLLGETSRELDEIEADQGDTQAPTLKLERLRGILKELKDIEEAMAATAPAPSSAQPKSKKNASVAWVQQAAPAQEIIRQMKARAERQIVALDGKGLWEPSNASGSDGSLDVDFSYLPMWHGPSQKIGIYLCQTTVRAPDGAAMDPPAQDQDQQADFWAIIDRLTLRRVREDLRNAVSRGLFNGMLVPVHFSTIYRHGSRAAFLELCTNIPEDLRKFLIWEIRSCPPDSWSVKLAEVLRPIAPFGRAIFLRLDDVPTNLPLIRRSLTTLRAAGIHKIGVDATALGNSEAEALCLLENVAQLAGDNRLKCYGEGFHSLSLTICAVCMGYQHLSGAAIAQPTTEPQGIRATAMEKIYGRFLEHDAAI